jgi:putative ubiquitin-RnfH superfamily antitoxin RatB of RatAB toxin-antitoxin module
MVEALPLQIPVVWVDAHNQLQERTVQLPAGACLQDALSACGLTLGAGQACGIWGRTKPVDQSLQAGDRVELYQPLKVDPKVARRERFAQQGARSAGLFVRRRANSKAGY